ncbi:SGNH/GDSL hydrolase family protein [Candidatus Woesearchaeota archaeon]|nr:SGNH/GDSL hydrolase family protein [Candidatus Woesearchaeota archaeon]
MTMNIAAFGDSHTNHTYDRPWTVVLEAMLRSQGIDAEVYNFGMPGIYAAEVKEIALEFLKLNEKRGFKGQKINPEMAILQGGANDIGTFAMMLTVKDGFVYPFPFAEEPRFETFGNLLDYLTKSHLGILHTVSELEEACLQLKHAGLRVAYLNIPPLRGSTSFGIDSRVESLRNGELVSLAAQYMRAPLNERLRKYCAENDIIYVDIASHVSDSDGSMAQQYDSGDGLHLGNAGQQKVAEAIFEAIRPVLQI